MNEDNAEGILVIFVGDLNAMVWKNVVVRKRIQNDNTKTIMERNKTDKLLH